MESKVCSKCLEIKHYSDFYKSKGYKHGIDSRCKKCKNLVSEKWRLENNLKYKDLQKNHYKYNKDRYTKWSKNFFTENPEYQNSYNKKYYLENLNKIKKAVKINSKKAIKNLTDKYIIEKLKCDGFYKNQINRELIDLKRNVLLIKRIKKEHGKSRKQKTISTTK